RDRRQALLEQKALTCDLVEEARLQHDIEHGVAHRHGERIAAEGGAVNAGRHTFGSFVGRQAGAHGEAAAYALGNRHHVRLDVSAFIGKEPARAAYAALDLVENQQDAVVVAELAQLAHRLQREVAYAALAL